MLKIGDFSRISQVTIKALRYYDHIGLLKPAHVDTFTGHRSYSLSQLPRLNRILALKEMGLSLDEIRELLDADLSPEEMRGMLKMKQAELAAALQSTQKSLNRVESRIQFLEQEGIMPQYDIVTKTLEKQLVLSIRQTVTESAEIAILFEDVGEAVRQHKINATGKWMALYHQEGYKSDELDVEIAVPIDKTPEKTIKLTDGREMSVRELASHEICATVIENANNESWSGSYTALGRWLEENDYSIVRPTREVYLTSPDDEQGWLVEIQFPVSKNVS